MTGRASWAEAEIHREGDCATYEFNMAAGVGWRGTDKRASQRLKMTCELAIGNRIGVQGSSRLEGLERTSRQWLASRRSEERRERALEGVGCLARC